MLSSSYRFSPSLSFLACSSGRNPCCHGARPSHQPDPEHLNRIHPSRRVRDPPEPLPSRRRSFSVPLRPPWGRARGQALATPARPSTPGLALCLASAPLASDVHYGYDDVHYLLGIKYMVAVRKAVLEDPDDDVRVVAVDTLIPTVASLVRLNDQMLNSVAMSLWDILLDLNDISPCTKVGHALVGSLMAEYDPVAKISIIPRGQAGGVTFFAPSEERLESRLYSRSYLENQMAVALGGRVAEEVIFGQGNVTTRASSDFMHVSRVARQMVERFGLMYPFW
ncbi:hypothetical protein ZWY2020_035446 [Hordeum vulgare]|nr:hypothetical protein ZWY2020_035446 [Hordeum vulgare]